MDTLDLAPLIEVLDDSIDGLEDALKPLLSNSLTENAGKLPLLDKAQLYVLVTYAIESLLFSYLRLNGVNAKEHPVFRELTRVKQYFEKIKVAETASDNHTPNVQLNKAAANRFIKHALSGNDRHDQRSAKELEERKLALQQRLASHKANSTQKKVLAVPFKDWEDTLRSKAGAMGEKRKSAGISDDDSEKSGESSSSEESEAGLTATEKVPYLADAAEVREEGTLKKLGKDPSGPRIKSKRPRVE